MKITIETPIIFNSERECKLAFKFLSEVCDQMLVIETYQGKPAIYTWFEIQERERKIKEEPLTMF